MRLHVLPSRHCLRQNRFDLLVVIDVLLSTTTLLTAMECLPDRIFVDPTMEQATLRAASLGPGVVLGGEQNGREPDGSDVGALPTAYTPDLLAGRQLVFVSNNGTPALTAADAMSLEDF